MKRKAAIMIGLLLCSQVHAESPDIQPTPLLESNEFDAMKTVYQQCVMRKGLQLLAETDFRTAMEYAPLVCRRDLLQIKRFMIQSAFKVDVAQGLVDSVAEGVDIDLANTLLDAMQNEE